MGRGGNRGEVVGRRVDRAVGWCDSVKRRFDERLDTLRQPAEQARMDHNVHAEEERNRKGKEYRQIVRRCDINEDFPETLFSFLSRNTQLIPRAKVCQIREGRTSKTFTGIASKNS